MMKRKLNNNTNTVNGIRLLEARKLAGFTSIAVGPLVGVSPQAISLYENCRSIPSFEVFEKLYTLYNLPYDFYFKPDTELTLDSPVYYRKLTRATKVKRDVSFIQAKLFITEIVKELQKSVAFPQVDPLFWDIKKSFSIGKESLDVEVMSRWIRKKWGLGYGPIENLTYELEKRGVIIGFLDLPNDIDGFSFWSENRPYIFVSHNNNAFRLRMSLAHELCHLFFHGAEDLNQDFKRIESEAKNFASAFLLPGISFLNEVVSLSLQGLLSLKPRWKISVAGLLMRCKKLHLIDEDYALYLNKQISRRRWRKVEPLDDSIAPDKSVLMRQAIQILLDKNVYTAESFKSALALPQTFIESVCCLDSGMLDTKHTNLIQIFR